MSMSTKIDDLPGPMVKPPIQAPSVQTQAFESGKESNVVPRDQLIREDNGSNITANIKKKVNCTDMAKEPSESVTFTDMIRLEVNEENMLLFVLFITAGLPAFSSYVRKLPIIGTYSNGGFATSMINAALLLTVYVLAKHFVIPKVRL